jgi:hypothetical protein
MSTARKAGAPTGLFVSTTMRPCHGPRPRTAPGIFDALLAVPSVLQYLESGQLLRVLPDWHEDAGPISLYFTSQKLLPAKTRVFIDFVTDSFREQDLARRFLA